MSLIDFQYHIMLMLLVCGTWKNKREISASVFAILLSSLAIIAIAQKLLRILNWINYYIFNVDKRVDRYPIGVHICTKEKQSRIRSNSFIPLYNLPLSLATFKYVQNEHKYINKQQTNSCMHTWLSRSKRSTIAK